MLIHHFSPIVHVNGRRQPDVVPATAFVPRVARDHLPLQELRRRVRRGVQVLQTRPQAHERRVSNTELNARGNNKFRYRVMENGYKVGYDRVRSLNIIQRYDILKSLKTQFIDEDKKIS